MKIQHVSVDAALESLHTRTDGLSPEESRRRLRDFGLNRVRTEAKVGPLPPPRAAQALCPSAHLVAGRAGHRSSQLLFIATIRPTCFAAQRLPA